MMENFNEINKKIDEISNKQKEIQTNLLHENIRIMEIDLNEYPIDLQSLDNLITKLYKSINRDFSELPASLQENIIDIAISQLNIIKICIGNSQHIKRVIDHSNSLTTEVIFNYQHQYPTHAQKFPLPRNYDNFNSHINDSIRSLCKSYQNLYQLLSPFNDEFEMISQIQEGRPLFEKLEAWEDPCIDEYIANEEHRLEIINRHCYDFLRRNKLIASTRDIFRLKEEKKQIEAWEKKLGLDRLADENYIAGLMEPVAAEFEEFKDKRKKLMNDYDNSLGNLYHFLAQYYKFPVKTLKKIVGFYHEKKKEYSEQQIFIGDYSIGIFKSECKKLGKITGMGKILANNGFFDDSPAPKRNSPTYYYFESIKEERFKQLEIIISIIDQVSIEWIPPISNNSSKKVVYQGEILVKENRVPILDSIKMDLEKACQKSDCSEYSASLALLISYIRKFCEHYSKQYKEQKNGIIEEKDRIQLEKISRLSKRYHEKLSGYKYCANNERFILDMVLDISGREHIYTISEENKTQFEDIKAKISNYNRIKRGMRYCNGPEEEDKLPDEVYNQYKEEIKLIESILAEVKTLKNISSQWEDLPWKNHRVSFIGMENLEELPSAQDIIKILNSPLDQFLTRSENTIKNSWLFYFLFSNNNTREESVCPYDVKFIKEEITPYISKFWYLHEKIHDVNLVKTVFSAFVDQKKKIDEEIKQIFHELTLYNLHLENNFEIGEKIVGLNPNWKVSQQGENEKYVGFLFFNAWDTTKYDLMSDPQFQNHVRNMYIYSLKQEIAKKSKINSYVYPPFDDAYDFKKNAFTNNTEENILLWNLYEHIFISPIASPELLLKEACELINSGRLDPNNTALITLIALLMPKISIEAKERLFPDPKNKKTPQLFKDILENHIPTINDQELDELHKNIKVFYPQSYYIITENFHLTITDKLRVLFNNVLQFYIHQIICVQTCIDKIKGSDIGTISLGDVFEENRELLFDPQRKDESNAQIREYAKNHGFNDAINGFEINPKTLGDIHFLIKFIHCISWNSIEEIYKLIEHAHDFAKSKFDVPIGKMSRDQYDNQSKLQSLDTGVEIPHQRIPVYNTHYREQDITAYLFTETIIDIDEIEKRSGGRSYEPNYTELRQRGIKCRILTDFRNNKRHIGYPTGIENMIQPKYGETQLIPAIEYFRDEILTNDNPVDNSLKDICEDVFIGLRDYKKEIEKTPQGGKKYPLYSKELQEKIESLLSHMYCINGYVAWGKESTPYNFIEEYKDIVVLMLLQFFIKTSNGNFSIN